MQKIKIIIYFFALIVGLFFAVRVSRAATIIVTPADNYTKIEAAVAGDTVLIAPGTYQFRVNLTKVGTAAAPIIIKAQDPNNRPVFDYTGKVANEWPGSYNAGDAKRACWQVWQPAAYYTVDGLIIKGCNGIDENAAGIRYGYTDHLTIKNTFFQLNQNGILGGGAETVVESCEFDQGGNGNNDQSHNIYILGGDNFTMRYSYLHDARGGQNFHIRARTSVLEYNWFVRAGSYEGDMMSPSPSYDMSPPADNIQRLLLLGNVFVTNPAPGNEGKVITMSNDTALANLSMELTALWNTFYITEPGSPAAVVQVRNDSLTSATVNFSNNIVAGNGRLFVVLGASGMSNYSISGVANWFTTGSNVNPLIETVFGADPGFVNAAAQDFTLTPGSSALGAADTSATPRPVSSYKPPNSIIARINVNDIGAFQTSASTDTSPPSTPANLTATAVSSFQIDLSWTASTDNVGVTGYKIYRCQGAGCTPSTQIGTSAINSYSDTGLSPSTTYVYSVTAYDTARNVSGQSSSASATTPAANLNLGLVGYWKFDETSGITTSDSSGNGNTGTLINGPVWTTGKINGALSFDGTNDYVDVGNNSALNLTDNFTISAWVKSNSVSATYYGIVSKMNGYTYYGYNLAISDYPTGKHFQFLVGDNTGIGYAYANNNIADTNWHHLVGVRQNGTDYLYVDGVKQNNSATHGLSSSSDGVKIGSFYNNFNGSNFNGLIDEVRIYNRALSGSEVTLLYNYTSTDTTPPAAPTGVTVN